MKENMPVDEQFKRAKVQIQEEKRYLSSLSIDTASIFHTVNIRSIFEDNFGEEIAQDQRSVDVANAIVVALKEGNLISLC